MPKTLINILLNIEIQEGKFCLHKTKINKKRALNKKMTRLDVHDRGIKVIINCHKYSKTYNTLNN